MDAPRAADLLRWETPATSTYQTGAILQIEGGIGLISSADSNGSPSPCWTSVVPPSTAFHAFIAGDIEPAGSPKVIMIGGRPAVRWQKGHKWTAAIRRELLEQLGSDNPIKGPVRGWIDFVMPKPKKPKFLVPATPPDIDKLLRAVLDGMVWKDKQGDGKWHGILIEDDARFISVGASERFVNGTEPTGVDIWVWPA